MGRIEPDRDRIRQALESIDLPKIDYVVVAHSHHDHAMDAPIVAELKHATLVGSQSTRNIAKGLRLGDLPFLYAYPGRQLSAGDFTVRFFVSPHSHYVFEEGRPHRRDLTDGFRTWLDEKLAGEIVKPLPMPACITDYKADNNYVMLIEHQQSNMRLLIVPSAGASLDLGDVKADVVFLGIGDADKLSNEHICQYWHEAVEKTEARLVIPVHWDNFFRPLDLKDPHLQPFPPFVDDMACTMETIAFLNVGGVDIKFMPPLESVAFHFTGPRGVGKHDAVGTSNPFTEGCRAPR